jgi:hypothetical protein
MVFKASLVRKSKPFLVWVIRIAVQDGNEFLDG